MVARQCTTRERYSLKRSGVVLIVRGFIFESTSQEDLFINLCGPISPMIDSPECMKLGRMGEVEDCLVCT